MINQSLFVKLFCSAWTVLAISYGGTVLLSRHLNKLVFANYEKYMQSDIIAAAQHDFNMKFDTFATDQSAEEKFKDKTWHAAIVSNSTHADLVKANLLKEINWEKLGLKKSDNIADIKTPSEALEIFSEQAKKIINKNGNDTDQIKYGIPYYMSYLSFFYRGSEIEKLKTEQKWSEIVKDIVGDDRFKVTAPSTQSKISMIDDYRTIYSLTELLNDAADPKPVSALEAEKPSANPPPVPPFAPSFEKWNTNGFNKAAVGSIFMTDQKNLVDMLAKKDIVGAFMKSRDALHALNGASSATNIAAGQFHSVIPDKLIYFMDSLAISKDIPINQEESLYKFIKKLLFSGMENKQTVFNKKEENYTNWSAMNFLDIKSAPTLKKMTDELKNNKELYSTSTGKDKKTDDVYLSLKQQLLLLSDPGVPTTQKTFYEDHISSEDKQSIKTSCDAWKETFKTP